MKVIEVLRSKREVQPGVWSLYLAGKYLCYVHIAGQSNLVHAVMWGLRSFGYSWYDISQYLNRELQGRRYFYLMRIS